MKPTIDGNIEVLPPDITTTETLDGGKKVQRIEHTIPKAKADAATLEKAIEVNKIQATQELKRQIKASKAQEEKLAKEYNEAEETFKKEFTAKELGHIRNLPNIKQLAKILSALFVCRVTAAGIVEKVQLSTPSGTYHPNFFQYFNKELTRANITVTTTVKAAALATANSISDADDDDIGEDYKGRKTITANGWAQEVVLTSAQISELRKIKKADDAYRAQKVHTTELEERLEGVGDQSDALKASVYRREIAKADGGEEIIALLDRSLEATVSGKYLALL